MTEDPLRDRAAHVHAMALRRLSDGTRRQALENLRRLEIHLQTASALDRRAELSDNEALAGVLRARAEERRRMAEFIRAHLVDADPPTDWPRPGPAAVRRGRPAS